jgi:4'-phosphopantetheinyl transferase
VSTPAWRAATQAEAVATFATGTVDVWRLAAPRGAPAVRELIACYAGERPESLRIVPGPHGKPTLDAAALRFNLSHSGGTTLLAFALGVDVGIDIEHARTLRRRDALLARCFTPDERAQVCAARDPDAALLAAWTAKEALVKAIGRGIAYGLRHVHLDLPAAGAPCLVALDGPAGPARRWRLRSLPPLPGSAAALAHGDAPLAMRCFTA